MFQSWEGWLALAHLATKGDSGGKPPFPTLKHESDTLQAEMQGLKIGKA